MLMFQPSSVEAETFCQYMTRLKWTYDKAVVELTPVGRALLKALNSPVLEETTADVFEIVLSPTMSSRMPRRSAPSARSSRPSSSSRTSDLNN